MSLLNCASMLLNVMERQIGHLRGKKEIRLATYPVAQVLCFTEVLTKPKKDHTQHLGELFEIWSQ